MNFVIKDAAGEYYKYSLQFKWKYPLAKLKITID